MVNFRFENPLRFGTDLWDPSHRFETSWLLPPYALAAVRATFVSLKPNFTNFSHSTTTKESKKKKEAEHPSIPSMHVSFSWSRGWFLYLPRPAIASWSRAQICHMIFAIKKQIML